MGILVVEDDAPIRAFLVEVLADAGHGVVAAVQGREAIRLLREQRPLPSLILLDLMMPLMDGWDVCAALAADPELAPIPVVVLSAISNLEARTRELRVVGALPKPIDLETLLDLAARFDPAAEG